MNCLYKKDQLLFAVLWMVLYMVLFGAGESISLGLGMAKIVTAPLLVAIALVLGGWIVKNGLGKKYGLEKVQMDYGKYLYFLPLILIASTNLWGGFVLRFSALETLLYIVSMICVGFMEEVIFRGFLFQALCQKNVKGAILLSSLTFGVGHIVNLLHGAEVFSTLLQICYAAAIGFLFTIIFYKSKSLLPCIAAHSTINSLSAFAGEGNEMHNTITAILLIISALSYGLWIGKRA